MTPEQAYERFRKIVTRAARRVADESQGLEVIPLADRVQESWVRIFSRLRQIEAAKHPKAYVWKLVTESPEAGKVKSCVPSGRLKAILYLPC